VDEMPSRYIIKDNPSYITMQGKNDIPQHCSHELKRNVNMQVERQGCYIYIYIYIYIYTHMYIYLYVYKYMSLQQ
jgi:hypothetical protein